MSSGDIPQEAEFAQVSSELNDGLRSCRLVIDNYRAMMGEQGSAANDDDEPADDGMQGYVSTTDQASASGDSGWDQARG